MLPYNNPAHYGYIAPKRFHYLFYAISEVLNGKGYCLWLPSEPSILAACESPETLLQYKEESTGRKFPLDQTNQMWFEYQLLEMGENAGLTGLYCLTVSNRDEKNLEKRHPSRVVNKRFTMFEIEGLIDFEGYLQLMTELLVNLGVKERHLIRLSYRSACIALGRDPDRWILTDEDEKTLTEKVSPAILLTHFPQRTNPFWNMAQAPTPAQNGETLYLKADLLLGGMECAGGAQRSQEKQKQLDQFYALPGYADTLFEKFGEITNDEMDYYMILTHILRSGCGIGLPRLSEGLFRYMRQTETTSRPNVF